MPRGAGNREQQAPTGSRGERDGPGREAGGDFLCKNVRTRAPHFLFSDFSVIEDSVTLRQRSNQNCRLPSYP
jgi:hypothetical protein